jgi:5-enolpyruvylshikimate-3-phosphate synthase
LGLVRDEVDVSEPDCVSKSWPKFWTDLAAAGAQVAIDIP